MKIRNTKEADKQAIFEILKQGGAFDDDSLTFVETKLDEYLSDPESAIWLTAEARAPVGIAYCIPEPITLGTWNLLMLWVDESQQTKGIGSQLVKEVEARIRNEAGRLLVVETSSLENFDGARTFYEKIGFKHEATIQDFYDSGDSKLVCTKRMT